MIRENIISIPTLSKFIGNKETWYKIIEIDDFKDKVINIEEELLKNELKTIYNEYLSRNKKIKLVSNKNVQKKNNIQNRRYIGNKNKLLAWIFELINENTTNCNSFCDIFAGTGVIANKALKMYDRVVINDFLFSNEIIYTAFFGNDNFDLNKVINLIDKYNKLDVNDIKPNYFSDNYGNKFFSLNNAKKIGFIREDILKIKTLNKKEKSILIASLIYSMDRVANTVGHFDAYLKKDIPDRLLELELIEIGQYKNIEIFRQDANTLISSVDCDILYIDPPYNSRQYSRFYHVYENLVQWKKPQLFGTALKPEPENMSKYCKVEAKIAFSELINNFKGKYIVVSYNNTYKSKSKSSENKITLEEINQMLSNIGETKVFEQSYKSFNTGKTDFGDHKEILFITKVR